MLFMEHNRHNGLTFVHQFRFILYVRDFLAQRAFYEEFFGWPIIVEWSNDQGGGGVMFDTGIAVFELISRDHIDSPNGSIAVSLHVPDVWALWDRVKNKVTVKFPLRDNPWGDASFCVKDPTGFLIILFSPLK